MIWVKVTNMQIPTMLKLAACEKDFCYGISIDTGCILLVISCYFIYFDGGL